MSEKLDELEIATVKAIEQKTETDSCSVSLQITRLTMYKPVNTWQSTFVVPSGADTEMITHIIQREEIVLLKDMQAEQEDIIKKKVYINDTYVYGQSIKLHQDYKTIVIPYDDLIKDGNTYVIGDNGDAVKTIINTLKKEIIKVREGLYAYFNNAMYENTNALADRVKAQVLSEVENRREISIKVNDIPQYKTDDLLPDCFDSILAYVVNNNPVMMSGSAGTGKGYIARSIAKALNAEFYEVNAVKNSYDLTGFMDATSNFVKTPFYNACKSVSEGKKAVFLFDEMDCSDPEVLKIFNEAISSLEFTFPNNERLNFEGLYILCACNTYGTGGDAQYVARQIDSSTLDRFVVVKVGYDKYIETVLARGDIELVRFIDDFREQCEKNGIMFVVSYRAIKRIISMRDVLPLKQVMKECLIRSMSNDDLECVLNSMYEKYNKYYDAAKECLAA